MIQLPVRRERNSVDGDERRRHHVVGQDRRHVRPHPARVHRTGPGSRHHVGHQLLAVLTVHGPHDRFPHPLVPGEPVLDLPQLHPVPADLHLRVDPPQELQTPVRQPTRQVPRPVQPRPRRTERIRHEPLRRQPRTPQIPPRHTRTTHIHLTRHTHRNQPTRTIQQMHRQIRQRHPDRIPRRPTHIPLDHPVIRRMNRRLGDPIHIHQLTTIHPHPPRPRPQITELQPLTRKNHHPQHQLVHPRITLTRQPHQRTKRRRRLTQHRHTLTHQHIHQIPRRPQHLQRRHHQPPPMQQRTPHLPHRHIKRIRMEQHPHIRRTEPEPLPHRPQQTHHIPMRHRHTLRHPRRTRRIDHIRLIVRTHPRHRIRHRTPRNHRSLTRIVQHHHGTLMDRPDQRRMTLLGHHDPRTRIRHDVSQPLHRIRRIQRQITRTRLQHTQQRRDQIDPPLQTHPHQRLRTRTQPHQMMRDPVRPLVQLPIRQIHTLERQRPRTRRHLHPTLEQPMDTLLPHHRHHTIPLTQQPPQLRPGQIRPPRITRRIPRHRLQHPPIHPHQTIGVRPADGVGGGGDAEPARVREDRQGEVIEGIVHAALHIDLAGVDLVEVLVVEHHVEQPLRTARVPLDGGQRVTAVPPDLRLPLEDLLHQLTPRTSRTVHRERHRVQMHPQHPVTTGRLKPPVHHQPGMERRLHRQHPQHLHMRRQQHTLQRRPRHRRQPTQPRLQVPIIQLELVVLRGCGVLLPADRQGEGSVQIGDVLPVGAVVLALERLQLGGDEVRVPHRRRLRKHQRHPVPHTPVRLQQLHQQGVVTPPLRDRMVLRERQTPGVLRLQMHDHPQQRRLGQIEQRRTLLVQELDLPLPQLLRPQTPQIMHRHRNIHPRMHQLQRLRIPRQTHRRPQHVMPARHQPHRLPQRSLHKRLLIRNTERVHIVVGVAAVSGQHLDQHAGLDLGERVGVHDVRRQRGPVLRTDQRERRHRLPRHHLAVLDRIKRQRRDRTVLEDLLDRQVIPRLPQRTTQPHRTDRIPAQVEEAVLHTDLLHRHIQHPRPHRRDPLLHRTTRRHPLTRRKRRPPRRRQSTVIQLPVRGQRHGVEPYDSGRHHVLGEPVAERGTQRLRFGGAQDVAGQVRVLLFVVAPYDHGGVVDSLLLAQGRLDLPQFDALAAELDLGVDAAEEVERSVGEPACEVAGGVHP